MTLNVTHRAPQKRIDLKNDYPYLADFENLPEKTVWDHFRNGSEEAYSFIYITFFPVLYNYGRQFTHDTALVKDALQDLFIHLWKRKEHLSPTDSIKFYLLAATRRRIIKLTGKLNVLSGNTDPEVFGMVMPIEAQIIADQNAKEQVLRVREAVNRLTPKQREVIFLMFYENLSHEQIAKILSLETKTIYNLLYKAIKGLKEIMGSLLLLAAVVLSWVYSSF